MNIAQPDREAMAAHYEQRLELYQLRFRIARQEIIDIALDRDHWKRNYHQMRLDLAQISSGDYPPELCQELLQKMAQNEK